MKGGEGRERSKGGREGRMEGGSERSKGGGKEGGKEGKQKRVSVNESKRRE